MPETICAVPHCFNIGDHIFSQNKERRDAWIHATRRGATKFKKWEPPTKCSYICKDHFVDDDYISVAYHGNAPLKRRLKKTAIPSKFKWKDGSTTPSVEARWDRVKRRRLFKDITNEIETEIMDKVTSELEACNDSPLMEESELCVGAYEVLSDEISISEEMCLESEEKK